MKLFSIFLLYLFNLLPAFISLAQEKKLSSENLNKIKLSFYFPQLNDIIINLDDKAPGIRASKLDIERAKANQIVVDSEKGLSANFNLSGHSIHENRPGLSYSQTYRTVGSIFIKKPIYHWGVLNSKSRIAKLGEDFAKRKNKINRSNLISQINAEFMDLVLLSRSITLKEENLNLIEQIESELLKRKEVGISTELDVSKQTILKIQKSIEVEESKRILSRELTEFKFLTGYSKSIELSIPETFLEFCDNHNFNQDIPQIVGSHSSMEIEQLKTLIKTENEKYFVASNSKKPKINMVSGFYQDQIDLPNSPDSVRRNNFLIGVEANWNIWDSSRSKGQKELALAQKRQFEIELENSVQMLRLEIETLRTQLKNLFKQISLSKKLVLANRSLYEKSRIEFDEKQITSNDLLSSKINLIESEMGLINSVFTYLKVEDDYNSHIEFTKP